MSNNSTRRAAHAPRRSPHSAGYFLAVRVAAANPPVGVAVRVSVPPLTPWLKVTEPLVGDEVVIDAGAPAVMLDQRSALLRDDETLLENYRRLNPAADDNAAYAMKCLCLPDPTTGAATVVDHVRLFPNHADMRWKEKALARTAPLGVNQAKYRPCDKLLSFLESL